MTARGYAINVTLIFSLERYRDIADRYLSGIPAGSRVATVVGCSWCVDFGTMLQRLEGLDVDRLAHIDDYPTSPHYTELERTVLAYADAMTAQPMTVTVLGPFSSKDVIA